MRALALKSAKRERGRTFRTTRDDVADPPCQPFLCFFFSLFTCENLPYPAYLVAKLVLRGHVNNNDSLEIGIGIANRQPRTSDLDILLPVPLPFYLYLYLFPLRLFPSASGRLLRNLETSYTHPRVKLLSHPSFAITTTISIANQPPGHVHPRSSSLRDPDSGCDFLTDRTEECRRCGCGWRWSRLRCWRGIGGKGWG